jgi:hypothetical protein
MAVPGFGYGIAARRTLRCTQHEISVEGCSFDPNIGHNRVISAKIPDFSADILSIFPLFS